MLHYSLHHFLDKIRIISQHAGYHSSEQHYHGTDCGQFAIWLHYLIDVIFVQIRT